MQMSANKNSILVVMAICMAIFYLLVGLDFDIFEYINSKAVSKNLFLYY